MKPETKGFYCMIGMLVLAAITAIVVASLVKDFQ